VANRGDALAGTDPFRSSATRCLLDGNIEVRLSPSMPTTSIACLTAAVIASSSSASLTRRTGRTCGWTIAGGLSQGGSVRFMVMVLFEMDRAHLAAEVDAEAAPLETVTDDLGRLAPAPFGARTAAPVLAAATILLCILALGHDGGSLREPLGWDCPWRIG